MNKMGPFANIRLALYTALKKFAPENLSVEDLIDKCISDVRQHHVPSESEADKIPWITVRLFLIKLLARVPVLKGCDGHPFISSFLTFDNKVADVVEEYDVAMEGALILHILDSVKVINYFDDRSALAIDLYLRDEGNNARVQKAISYLIRNKLVEYDQTSISVKDKA